VLAVCCRSCDQATTTAHVEPGISATLTLWRYSKKSRQIGFPKAIRVDQGTEFVSREIDLWSYRRGGALDFSQPGKFNGKFRAECLNAHWL
jgi:hypothetical protein